MKALLIGNYGAGNLGDEMLREYFLESFPEIDWVVVSAAPGKGEVPRMPFGVRSLLCTSWWRKLKVYRSCNAVVFGGGTLFTDIESLKACVLWWWHAFWARVWGKPIFLAFHGVGPFRTDFGRRLTLWVLRRARFISVRDAASKMRVWELVPNNLCVQSFDPVFLSFSKENSCTPAKNVFIVVPRKNTSDNFGKILGALLKSQPWDTIRFLSLEPKSQEEKEMIEMLAKGVGGKVEQRGVETTLALWESLHDASVVLSQRYHAAIAALAMKKDVHIIPQAPGDKLETLPQGRFTDAEYQEHLEHARRGENALREALSSVLPSGASSFMK